MGKFLRSQVAVTLVGGAPASAVDLTDSARIAPCLAAADGGAETILRAGEMPRAVIGDLDSLSSESRARIPPERLCRIEEQDSTDFQKCMREIDAPLVIGLGFCGGRLDHTLAVLSSLPEAPWPCLLIGEEDVIFPVSGEVALELPVGARLSVFPMRPVSGSSSGLFWPLDGIAMAPGGAIGTSNRVTGPVRLAFDRPGALVLLDRHHLRAALDAIGGIAAPSAWSGGFSSSGR